MKDLLYKIAITQIPMVGAVTAKTLISYCGSARGVFEARKRELVRIPGIGERTAESIVKQRILSVAEEEIAFLERYQIQPLFYLDKAYPSRLSVYADCPLMLYYKGNADLNAPRIAAIVGTRRPTAHGVAICEELVNGLNDYGAIVVSGLALGIDAAAHRKCVEIDLPTIGVLGHGLRHIYPQQHHALAERMLACGGLLTEHISTAQPDKEHFPMRNRIIAGMCDALIVVETGKKGGSMITAQFADSYNKDVFSVPGRPGDRNAEGCNHLIKSNKAALIENAADLAYLMRWESATPLQPRQTTLFVELSPEEKIIVDLLNSYDMLSIDQLMVATDKTGSQLAAHLLSLECKGVLRTLPGKRYMLVSKAT